MFSHLNDLELSVVILIVAIFVIKPIPLFVDRNLHKQINLFQSSQTIQLNWINSSINRQLETT